MRALLNLLIHLFPRLLAYATLLIGLFGIMMATRLRSNENDVWLHLKAGELIWQRKNIPKTEPFSAVLYGKPWIDLSWGAQVTFYGLHRLLPLSSIRLLLFLLIFTLYIHLSLKAGLSLTEASLATPLIVWIIATNYTIRPHWISVILFTWQLLIIHRAEVSKELKWRDALALILLQAIWANFHAYHIVGLTNLLIPSLIHIPMYWFSKNPSELRLTKRYIYALLMAVILTILTSPYHLQAILYPIHAAKYNLQFLNRIVELASLFPISSSSHYPRTGLIILVTLFILTILPSNRSPLPEKILTLWYIYLAGMAMRNQIFLPSLGLIFLLPGYRRVLSNRRAKMWLLALGFILTYHITFNLILPSYSPSFMYANKQYDFWETDHDFYCQKALNFLKEIDAKGNLLCSFDLGSKAIYELHPNIKVCLDGRSELYPTDYTHALDKIFYNGNFVLLTRMANKYNIKFILWNLLNPKGPDTAFLLYLLKSGQWIPIYADEVSLVCARNVPANQRIICDYRIKSPVLKVLRTIERDYQLLPKDIPAKAYLKWARLVLSPNNPEIQEVIVLLDHLRFITRSPVLDYELGKLLLLRGNTFNAVLHLNRAYISNCPPHLCPELPVLLAVSALKTKGIELSPNWLQALSLKTINKIRIILKGEREPLRQTFRKGGLLERIKATFYLDLYRIGGGKWDPKTKF